MEMPGTIRFLLLSVIFAGCISAPVEGAASSQSPQAIEKIDSFLKLLLVIHTQERESYKNLLATKGEVSQPIFASADLTSSVGIKSAGERNQRYAEQTNAIVEIRVARWANIAALVGHMDIEEPLASAIKAGFSSAHARFMQNAAELRAAIEAYRSLTFDVLSSAERWRGAITATDGELSFSHDLPRTELTALLQESQLADERIGRAWKALMDERDGINELIGCAKSGRASKVELNQCVHKVSGVAKP